MINSIIRPVGQIKLPQWTGAQLYMHATDARHPELPRQFQQYQPVVEEMLDASSIDAGEVYITLDEKDLVPQETHRRGGAHIDGIWVPRISAHTNPSPGGDWRNPGPRWSTTWESTRNAAGMHRDPGGHIMPDHDIGGGLILLSNAVGCRYWNGRFDTKPGEGGDLEHIRSTLDASPSEVMNPNTAYLCNVWGVHESIPMTRPMRRSLVRISLPETAKVN